MSKTFYTFPLDVLTLVASNQVANTVSSSDDEYGTIRLRCSGDHVLDEIPVTRGIDDGDVVVLGLELPQSDIDGDTTLTLGLQLVQDPGIFERALAHLKSGREISGKTT